ncbi:MAG: hypothetical protein RXR43_11730 [Sulfolobus sp.]
MNKIVVIGLVVGIIIIGIIAGLHFTAHKTATVTTTPSQTTTTTPPPPPPQSSNVIMFYKYNSTYYVFIIPITNNSGPQNGPSWYEILTNDMYTPHGICVIGYCNITGLCVVDKPYGVPYYKNLGNGYAMIFAHTTLTFNYTFTKGEIYDLYLVTAMHTYSFEAEYGGSYL